MKVGDELELEFTAVDDRGRGVAHCEGRRVLAPNVFGGERARVRVAALARHSDQAHAHVRELLRPSAERRTPPCPRHEYTPRARPTGDSAGPRRNPACHGCPLMALEHRAQLEQLRARLEAELGLRLEQDIITAGAEFGYRCSSKRLVARRGERLILGSRAAARRRGDYVADMHGCLVEHPRIRAAFDTLEALANELGVQAWEPGLRGQAPRGDLRYVWAKTNGEQVLVTLISGGETSRVPELGARLHATGGVAGVAWSVQPQPGNAIRGRAAQTIAGVDQVRVELAGVEVEVGALGFMQANLELAGRIYRDLIGDAAGALALDLYAGAGITTRLLGRRFTEVVPCESYAESAAGLGVAPERAEDFLQRWRDQGRPRPELVVANPPRAGLGDAVCAGLRSLAAPRLHLMSCSPESLAEDLRRLAPDYELLSLRAYDMLPQTAHLELVAWLVARS